MIDQRVLLKALHTFVRGIVIDRVGQCGERQADAQPEGSLQQQAPVLAGLLQLHDRQESLVEPLLLWHDSLRPLHTVWDPRAVRYRALNTRHPGIRIGTTCLLLTDENICS